MTRVPINDEIAADILYRSDRTCCVCRERGKRLQIHHLDENNTNSNDPENLAPLCFDCHDETQIRGGFGRSLNVAQVRKFRDEWYASVRRRRETAERLAVELMTGRNTVPSTASTPSDLQTQIREAVFIAEGFSAFGAEGARREAISREDVQDYARQLPELLRRAKAVAQPEWDSGTTSRMVNATYGVIDVLEGMLVTLAGYYPRSHFDAEDPKTYFSELIATRFRWHRYHMEPEGKGRNGTIVNVLVGGAVMSDAKTMVSDMVRSLVEAWSGFADWRIEWERE